MPFKLRYRIFNIKVYIMIPWSFIKFAIKYLNVFQVKLILLHIILIYTA
jgi:hypothetical protein